jgi:hypothetical protein
VPRKRKSWIEVSGEAFGLVRFGIGAEPAKSPIYQREIERIALYASKRLAVARKRYKEQSAPSTQAAPAGEE